jgi:hypothetical protein
MKILLTGMSSAHTSSKVHAKTFGFFGALHEALTSAGHDVSWIVSDINWDKDYLETYDSIFVGVMPPTSVSAHRSYGALNVIDLMFSSEKLNLVVDTQQYWLIEPSLKTIVSNPDQLIKEFNQKRYQYVLACNPKNLAKLVSACNKLLTMEWPKTVYPELPWSDEKSIVANLPPGAMSSLVGFNFDEKYIIKSFSNPVDRQNTFLSDDPSNPWVLSVSKTIESKVLPIRPSKAHGDSDTVEALTGAIGALIPPQKRGGGTWWSFLYVHSMNTHTPVVTEWREAQSVSPQWGILASTLETMDQYQRHLISLEQKLTYLSSISKYEDSIKKLNNLINLGE